MVANLDQTPSCLMDESSPQLYIVCLAAEKAGQLHGAWIEVTLEIEALNEEIKSLLAKSPVPGGKAIGIRAYRGFYSFKLDQGDCLGAIRDQAVFISKHGELGAVMLNYYDKEIMAAERAMIDQYQGEFQDKLDYATRLFNEKCLHAIPKPLHGYIDYLQFKKDIFMKDYFSITLQGVCYVFSGTATQLDDEEFDDFGP